MVFYPCPGKFEPKIKQGYSCFVYLKDATWNNKSGYKIFNEYENPLYRGYDVDIRPLVRTRGGKCAIFKEYHHDKPTGHLSVFIMLTPTEVLNPRAVEKYTKLANQVINEYIEVSHGRL